MSTTTATKEQPILFKAEMVRAILNGSKTQTRRVVEPQPDEDGLAKLISTGEWHDTNARTWKCFYGEPGDRLWVWERWNGSAETGICYQATEPDMDGAPWRTSIFMPRWASRITLEITAVRVELLQSISEADARAEGVRLSWRAVSPSKAQSFWWDYLRSEPSCPWARESFGTLWQSINGHGSWDANPWVWVVEFRRVQP
jgi:hypothetical protein